MEFRFRTPEFFKGEAITPEEAEHRLLKDLEDPNRNSRQTLWNLSILYGSTNRLPQAIQCVERLLEDAAGPEEKAGCLLALGQYMEKANDFPAAVGFYRAAYSLEPCDPKVCYFIRNNLGYCLNSLGHYEEAEQYLTQALSISPDRYNAHKNMGISCEGCGDYIQAAEYYIAAIQRNASDPRALAHLERLVNREPTLLVDVPDLPQKMEACRQAVAFARKAWSDVGPRPNGPTPR